MLQMEGWRKWLQGVGGVAGWAEWVAVTLYQLEAGVIFPPVFEIFPPNFDMSTSTPHISSPQ